MPSWLNVKKVTQASAVILKRAPGGRISYVRLLKLLYMVERESLKERGIPFVADRIVAMDHGPVLSRTYSLIKAEVDAQDWRESIKTEKYDVELVHFPGTSELSRWEMEKIHEVISRFEHLSDWDLVNHLHEILGEWQKNEPARGNAKDIPLADILTEVGRAGMAEAIESDLRAADRLRRLIRNA